MENLNKGHIYFIAFAIGLTLLVLQIFSRPIVFTAAQENATPTIVPSSADWKDWQAILEPNKTCALPCLWNMIPGETTLPEVAFILFQNFAGVTIASSNFADEASLLTANFNFNFDGDSTPFLETEFHFRERVLQQIFVSAQSNRFMKDIPIQTLNHFSITNLLQSYGIPDSARLYADKTNTGFVADNVQLYWRSIGLYVHYQRCQNWCLDIENPEKHEGLF